MKQERRELKEIMEDMKKLTVELIESEYAQGAINPETGTIEFVFQNEQPGWPRVSKRAAIERMKRVWPMMG